MEPQSLPPGVPSKEVCQPLGPGKDIYPSCWLWKLSPRTVVGL